MFLTQLTLNPRSTEARRDLSNAYDMHRTLSRAFSIDSVSQPSRFLWRLESNSISWKPPQILVQSAIPGNWEVLQNLSGYLAQEVDQKNVDISTFLQAESKKRFRFLANPTVKRNNKRYGLLTEESQLNWLERQGEQHGFLIQFALVNEQDLLNNKNENHRLIVHRVLFEGQLKVIDSEKLANALITGIGPAKAFGCGMLSLAQA